MIRLIGNVRRLGLFSTFCHPGGLSEALKGMMARLYQCPLIDLKILSACSRDDSALLTNSTKATLHATQGSVSDIAFGCTKLLNCWSGPTVHRRWLIAVGLAIRLADTLLRIRNWATTIPTARMSRSYENSTVAACNHRPLANQCFGGRQGSMRCVHSRPGKSLPPGNTDGRCHWSE
jgi:hypothetical protein